MTDFAPGLADDEHAGVEAALEAAGILDAWVTPEGNPWTGMWSKCPGSPPWPGNRAPACLVPAIDRADPQAAALDEVSIASVLSAIGVSPGPSAAARPG